MKRGILCILTSAFGFSLMAMLVRLVDDLGAPIPAIEKAFFRNLVALMIALPAYLAIRRELLGNERKRGTLWMLILRSGLGTLGLLANFYALSHIPIGDAMALNKTAPFFTVAISALLLGEALKARQAICIATAFVGAMLVVKPCIASMFNMASVVGLLSGFCAGAAYAIVHRLGKAGINGAYIVFFFSAFSCVACLPFILADPHALNIAQTLALIGAGGGAAIGQFGITWAYRFAEPRQIAVFDYTGIIFAALWGFAIFGQIPDALSAMGMAVIIIAAFMLHHHKCKVAVVACMMLACNAFGEERLEVEFDDVRGGVSKVAIVGDGDNMNWVEGLEEWGTPAPEMNLGFAKAQTAGAVQTAIWTNRSMRLDVRREVRDGKLEERYTITNVANFPLYFARGDTGIYATFNDSYESAGVCMTKRCHAHVWCGGAFGGVRAQKMGPYKTELGLFLTEGTLDAYSTRRIAKRRSNDRGDFILHQEPFCLKPAKSKTLAWKLVAFREGEFKKAALASGNAAVIISFEHETIFENETFHLLAEAAENITTCRVTANGREIDAQTDGKRVMVEYRPDKLGEVAFVFELNGRCHRAFGYVAEKLEKLVERRVARILEDNQCLEEDSPLFGALLAYDNEENHQHYIYDDRNHNAARERAGMGLLLARWAKTHPSEKLTEALSRYENFLIREIWDDTTGEVYNTIHHRDFTRKRHYNGPWYINFWLEMYYLTGKSIYLDRMEKGIKCYYEKAGMGFYPVACFFGEMIATIRAAGRDTRELERLLREHVEVIKSRGNGYPAQEVDFEHSLVTPPNTILSGYVEYIRRDAEVISAISNHIAVLTRFDGDAPDHHLAGIPIRHWDDYWFGKDRLYGDTMPHYWSGLSGYDYAAFARLSGDDSYRRRADRVLRNMLCLFFADGRASCAYMNQYSVTMVNEVGEVVEPARRGEHFDPLSNDQDFGLFLVLKCIDKK